MVFKYKGRKYSVAATNILKGYIVPNAINNVSLIFINPNLSRAEQSRVFHKLLKKNNLQDLIRGIKPWLN